MRVRGDSLPGAVRLLRLQPRAWRVVVLGFDEHRSCGMLWLWLWLWLWRTGRTGRSLSVSPALTHRLEATHGQIRAFCDPGPDKGHAAGGICSPILALLPD